MLLWSQARQRDRQGAVEGDRVNQPRPIVESSPKYGMLTGNAQRRFSGLGIAFVFVICGQVRPASGSMRAYAAIMAWSPTLRCRLSGPAMAGFRRPVRGLGSAVNDVTSPFKDKPPAYLNLVHDKSKEEWTPAKLEAEPLHILRFSIGGNTCRSPAESPPDALMAKVVLTRGAKGSSSEKTVWSTRVWVGEGPSEREATYKVLAQALLTATTLNVKKLQLVVDSLILAREVCGHRRTPSPSLAPLQAKVTNLVRTFPALSVLVAVEGENVARQEDGGEEEEEDGGGVDVPHGEVGSGRGKGRKGIAETGQLLHPLPAADSTCVSVKDATAEQDLSKLDEYLMRFDGGSRGNPGPSGAGVALYKSDGKGETWKEVHSAALWLGSALTNNQAEYKGLVAGLQIAKKLGVKRLRVEGDSELVVRQIQGQYKVRSTLLRPLHEEAMELFGHFADFSINYIEREANSRADRLANKAMDERLTTQRSSLPPPIPPRLTASTMMNEGHRQPSSDAHKDVQPPSQPQRKRGRPSRAASAAGNATA